MITFCLYVGTITALAVPLIVPVGLVFAGVTTLGLVSGPHSFGVAAIHLVGGIH